MASPFTAELEMRMKHLPRHGYSKHPHYKRWAGMTQRCYNENDPHYYTYGALGIGMEWRWHPYNPNGVKNFLNWLEYELERFWQRHPERRQERVEVARVHVRKNFGPKNCIIAFEGESAQRRVTTVLTAEIVVAMRRHAKAQMTVSVAQMKDLFGYEFMTIYRALRGLTWKTVNDIEPPLTQRLSMR